MLFFITKRFSLLEPKCKKYCLPLGVFAKLVSIPIFFQKDGSLLKSPFIQLLCTSFCCLQITLKFSFVQLCYY